MNVLKGKNILVTGGTGFLGSHLLERLAKTEATIVVLKRTASKLKRLEPILDRLILYDIDNVELSSVFEKHRPDMVIHCATDYGKDSDVIQLIYSNLMLPLRLLGLCSEYHSIFINTDTILDKRINTYTLSKKQFLEWLRFFSNNLVCVNVSLEHFYGPLDNKSKFCSYIILSLLNEVEKIDLTPGKQKRDFIYIDDVVDLFMLLIEHSFSFSKGLYLFEGGTGHAVKIKDFVLLVKKLIGNKTTKLNFGAIDYRSNEVMEYKVNNKPLRRLGWKPKYDLIRGLKKTILAEKGKLLKKDEVK